jgi:hypothetical protein
MRRSVSPIGLPVFAFWLCILPVPVGAQNPPPAGVPRTPATPPAEHDRAQSAGPANPGEAAAQTSTPPQIPTRTEILNFENSAITCNEFADAPRARRCPALLQIRLQNTNQIVFTWTVAMDERKRDH